VSRRHPAAVGTLLITAHHAIDLDQYQRRESTTCEMLLGIERLLEEHAMSGDAQASETI
jgi:hypothetical protein